MSPRLWLVRRRSTEIQVYMNSQTRREGPATKLESGSRAELVEQQTNQHQTLGARASAVSRQVKCHGWSQLPSGVWCICGCVGSSNCLYFKLRSSEALELRKRQRHVSNGELAPPVRTHNSQVCLCLQILQANVCRWKWIAPLQRHHFKETPLLAEFQLQQAPRVI